MRKAIPPPTPAPFTVTPEELATIADYFTRSSDTERVMLEERKNDMVYQVREYQERIEARERDIASYRDDIEHMERELYKTDKKLSTMATPPPVTAEQVRADVKRALSLSFIKNISIVQNEGRTYIEAQTRENVLKTTLNQKYSRSERWYKSKPYSIPLPVYNIRIGTRLTKTLSNNEGGLAIALADANDTAHYLDWTRRYSHEPHTHWGTTSVSSSSPCSYKSVCLGEFEGEVSSAFRKSLVDGLIAFAIYLQTAGSAHAYVDKRELWALWMGKAEYNTAIVPSEKEEKVLAKTGEEVKESDDEDTYCSCRETVDDDCDNDECECSCH